MSSPSDSSSGQYSLTSRLFDVAIALHLALSGANIRYGVFGGCAFNAFGSRRESQNVDCVVSAGRKQTIEFFVRQGRTSGFVCDNPIVQLKNDCEHIDIMWTEEPDESDVSDVVWIKLYPIGRDRGPNTPALNLTPVSTISQLQLESVTLNPLAICGETNGDGTALFLPPINLLKSKVRAAATRELVQDIYHIIWIVENSWNTKKDKGIEDIFDMYDVGRATLCWPILVELLEKIGIDVIGAERLVAGVEEQSMSGKSIVEGLF